MKLQVNVGLLALCLLIFGVSQARADSIHPGPQFSPREVVEIVMNALGDNNSPSADAGIELTFRFAAPSNKRVTGPIERFAEMVKGETYRPLIDHREYEVGAIRESGNNAFVPIILSASDGRTMAYMFRLGKQVEAPFEGAWMTEAVYPIDLLPVDKSSGVSA